MAWLYKRPGSKMWWIGWRDGGRQFLLSTKTADKSAALKKLHEQEHLMQIRIDGRLTEQFIEAILLNCGVHCKVASLSVCQLERMAVSGVRFGRTGRPQAATTPGRETSYSHGVRGFGTPPKETASPVLPEKRRLYWSWNFTLVIGGEEWPPNKGHHFEDFHNDPDKVTALLRCCDSWFNSAIPEYIQAHVRRSILEEVEKVAGPGEIPKTEVMVELNYEFKIWTPGERPLELKGTKEHAIKLDRQLRGHLMAVKYSFEQGIFRFARAHFRHLAAGWIQRLPPSAARENALRQIKQDLGQIVGPDMLAEDELPPTVQDIEIANPDIAD